MGFLLPCSLPIFQSNELLVDQTEESSSSSSSSNSSLSSQHSLPSVPSLSTPPHHHLPQPSAAHHHCLLSTLQSHSSYVFSLALSGKHLFSGSSDTHIRVWNRHNPPHPAATSPDNVVAAAPSAVKSIAVLGDKLFTAHQDHKIRVWKIDLDSSSSSAQSFKCISTLPTLNDRVGRLFSAKNYVEIRRHKKRTWVHHVDAVSALAVSGDGSLLYSVSWDRTFKIWRTSDFKCLESVWNAHDDAINAVALSNDGFVYTGSADRKIKVWKRSDGTDQKKQKHSLVATLEKHKSAVNALALSSDGSVLYSGACDRSIIVWERDRSNGGGGEGEGHMVVGGALRGHTKAILCLAVVSDLLCSGSADKTVRIWKRGVGISYSCLAVLEGHRGPVKCLTGAVDSSNLRSDSGTSYKVYSGSLDCDIKVWQLWVPLSTPLLS